MVSPLFQVFSIERALSTPFNLAHTFAAARAVLFSPNSTMVYKLPSNLMIMPRLISALLAIGPLRFWINDLIQAPPGRTGKGGGKSTSKSAGGKDFLKMG